MKAAEFWLENQKKQLKNAMETQQKAIKPKDYDRKNPERTGRRK